MNQGRLAQLSFAFGGFFGKYMIFQWPAAFDLACAGSFEPLGRRPICFHLRHRNSFKCANIFKSKPIGNKNLHQFAYLID
jgi:hypothetical protein